jgi:hypothetical protein
MNMGGGRGVTRSTAPSSQSRSIALPDAFARLRAV